MEIAMLFVKSKETKNKVVYTSANSVIDTVYVDKNLLRNYQEGESNRGFPESFTLTIDDVKYGK